MPHLSETELRKASYAVEGRTVLIEGAEALLKRRALKGVIDAALSADAQQYALRILECAKSARGGVSPNAAEIMAEVQTPAFLSPKHVVVVREIQRLPADEERKLAKWIVNVPDDALLLLVTGGDGAAGKTLSKAVAKDGTLVMAALPRNRKDAAAAWVREEARSLGKEIDPAAAHYLVYERTDSDLTLIRSELEKLVLYAADAPRITRQHVEEATPRSIEQRTWDLTDAMSEGECAKALGIVHELLQEQRQEPQMVLGGIASAVREIWQVKCLLDRGWRPGQQVPESASEFLLTGRSGIGRLLGAPDFRVKKTVQRARDYTWPALHSALRRLGACDLAIKGIEGGDSKQVALDLLVAALCARRRPARV
jgi:DNA polymerase-3 subunit delta